jgi:hypothetical protein
LYSTHSDLVHPAGLKIKTVDLMDNFMPDTHKSEDFINKNPNIYPVSKTQPATVVKKNNEEITLHRNKSNTVTA